MTCGPGRGVRIWGTMKGGHQTAVVTPRPRQGWTVSLFRVRFATSGCRKGVSYEYFTSHDQARRTSAVVSRSCRYKPRRQNSLDFPCAVAHHSRLGGECSWHDRFADREANTDWHLYGNRAQGCFGDREQAGWSDRCRDRENDMDRTCRGQDRKSGTRCRSGLAVSGGGQGERNRCCHHDIQPVRGARRCLSAELTQKYIEESRALSLVMDVDSDPMRSHFLPERGS